MLDIYSPSYSRVEKVSGLINSVAMAEWNVCVAEVHQAGPTLSITSKKLEFRMNKHPSGLNRCVNGCSSVLSLTRTRFQYPHSYIILHTVISVKCVFACLLTAHLLCAHSVMHSHVQ